MILATQTTATSMMTTTLIRAPRTNLNGIMYLQTRSVILEACLFLQIRRGGWPGGQNVQDTDRQTRG